MDRGAGFGWLLRQEFLTDLRLAPLQLLPAAEHGALSPRPLSPAKHTKRGLRDSVVPRGQETVQRVTTQSAARWRPHTWGKHGDGVGGAAHQPPKLARIWQAICRTSGKHCNGFFMPPSRVKRPWGLSRPPQPPFWRYCFMSRPMESRLTLGGVQQTAAFCGPRHIVTPVCMLLLVASFV